VAAAPSPAGGTTAVSPAGPPTAAPGVSGASQALPTPGEAPPQRALPGSIDEKAKRLADFFNGEVISDFSDDMA